jgi:serine/threonine protein kinase
MKTLKKGGDLIGKGAYGCVFNMEFPCKSTTLSKKGEKYISKIFFHKKAVTEAKSEFELNKLIYRIKDHTKWSVLWQRICRPHSYKEIYKHDKKITECLKKSGLTADQFNKRSAMLIGKYGGKSLEKIFEIKMKKIKNKNDFISFFLKTMKRMLPLFEGIKSLKNNGITHSDIKRGNIVLDGQSFKLIDFGLAYRMNDNKEYSKRSNMQFFDDRIYTPYPIDFVYTHTNKTQENTDRRAYLNNDTKRNFDEYLDIHQIFFKRENIKHKITEFLKDVKVDKKNILKTLDVYSLGYIIPKAFYNDLYLSGITLDDISEYVEDPSIKPFITLFKDMTREIFFNEGERITPEEAYNRFSELVRNVEY